MFFVWVQAGLTGAEWEGTESCGWEAATGGAGWDAMRAGSTWKGALIYLLFLSRNFN